VAPHEQHPDFGTHSNHATRQLEATHAFHVGTGDQRVDVELRRPAEGIAGDAIGGIQHVVSLFAEGAEKRNAVVVVVVDEEHGEAALEGRMPGHFRRVRSEPRLAGGRGAGVYRPHYRHRGVESCTGGDWELGSTEMHGIGTGNFAGAGAGPGFRGPGPFVSSFRSSPATSPPSLVDRWEAILRVPLRPSA
jgi:hypothetical protein